MLFMTIPTTKNDPAELEQLLLRIQSGDQLALAALYRAARVPVYALALSMLRHPQDAQDLTQDTFVRIWEKAQSYRPHGSPMAWVLTVARNLARMRLRQGTRTVELTEAEWNALPAGESVSAEDRMLLQTALKILKPEEQQVVLLHAVSGLKHREIAAVLGRPLPTVLSQYHRSLKKLSVQMEGDDNR